MVVSPEQPTASRLGRLRSAATKRTLYNSANRLDATADMEDKLQSLINVVNNLQGLMYGSILQVPCFLPQPSADWGTHYSSWVDQSLVEPEMTAWVPDPMPDHRHVVAGSYMLWSPSKKDRFIFPGTQTRGELEHEAAVQLQRFFRSSSLRYKDESNGDNANDDLVCGSCSKSMGFQFEADHEGDACDICAAVHHTSCLETVVDDCAERLICGACLEQHVAPTALGFCSMVVETTTSNKEFPEQDANLVCASAAASQAKHDEEDVCRALDVSLDYIMKFLEGQHVKSGKVTGEQRARILERVKAAIVWKQDTRSSAEVQRLVDNLNGMMSEIVQQL